MSHVACVTYDALIVARITYDALIDHIMNVILTQTNTHDCIHLLFASNN